MYFQSIVDPMQESKVGWRLAVVSLFIDRSSLLSRAPGECVLFLGRTLFLGISIRYGGFLLVRCAGLA